MTPLSRILADVLARLRAAIVQPDPLEPAPPRQDLPRVDRAMLARWEAEARQYYALDHACQCFEAGRTDAAAVWLIAATSPDGVAHLRHEEPTP